MSDEYRHRIVVSGSRTWGIVSPDPLLGSSKLVAAVENAVAHAALNHMLEVHGQDMVIAHGGARGLDRFANRWAEARHIDTEVHALTPEDWKRTGKAAGPFRNAQMIAHRTEVVLAFWGRSSKDPTRLSEGTGGMIKMAQKRGIPVIVLRSPWVDLETLT